MRFSVELKGMPAFAYPAKDGVYAPDGKLTRPTRRFVCEAESAEGARALFCSVLGVASADPERFVVGKAQGKGDSQPPAQPSPAPAEELVPLSEVRAALDGAGARIQEAEAAAQEALERAALAEAGAAAAETRARELEARLSAPPAVSQAPPLPPELAGEAPG